MSWFVKTPLAASLGWTLLHSIWEGAVVAAMLALALVAFRSPRARYAAGYVAMLVMCLALSYTLVHLAPAPSSFNRNTAPGLPLWRFAASQDASLSPSPVLSAVAPRLAPIWILGIWIFSLRQLAAWMFVCRLRRRGVCAAPVVWQNALQRLKERLLISRPVVLFESCIADTPMVLGYFRPVIFVPVGLFTGFPAAQIELILLHELAHIRRHDYLVNVLQRAVEAIFFYHPAMWWFSHVIRVERENCCDDAVVAISGNAHEFASALAALEQRRLSVHEPALAVTGGTLMKRIHRLLYPTAPSSAWAPLLTAAILVATAFIALNTLRAEPQQAQAQTQASRYENWLNQDVVYIIDNQERDAFLKLTTDAERDMFIKQFWMRRDPSFKEEHYRRIAYANERLKGWQTDRGHMYIVYGPPDELEQHPARRDEVWMYHHIEKVGDRLFFKFIDRTGRGDYQLAPTAGNP